MNNKIHIAHKDLNYLVKINYSQIYSKLKRVLSPEELLCFARVDIRTNDSIWYIDRPEKGVSYPKATPAQQAAAGEVLLNIKEKLRMAFEKDAEMYPYVNTLFKVPADDRIYLFPNGDGGVAVTLAPWGCSFLRQQRDFNPVGHIIQQAEKDIIDVQVQASYSDGSIIADQTLYFCYGSLNKAMNTNAEGVLQPGKLRIASEFVIANTADRSQDEVACVVEKNKTNYPIVFPFYVEASVQVLNQLDEPMPNYDVHALHSQKEELLHTDSEGYFNIGRIVLDNNPLRLVSAANKALFQEYALQKEENQLVFKITDDIKRTAILRIQEKGTAKPLENYPIQLRSEEQTSHYTSDNEGNAIINDLSIDQNIEVIDGKNEYNYKQYTIQQQDNNFIFEVELPKEKTVTILVLDHKKKPLINHPVDIKWGEQFHKRVTNNKGELYFPHRLFTHKEKVEVIVHKPLKTEEQEKPKTVQQNTKK